MILYTINQGNWTFFLRCCCCSLPPLFTFCGSLRGRLGKAWLASSDTGKKILIRALFWGVKKASSRKELLFQPHSNFCGFCDVNYTNFCVVKISCDSWPQLFFLGKKKCRENKNLNKKVGFFNFTLYWFLSKLALKHHKNVISYFAGTVIKG